MNPQPRPQNVTTLFLPPLLPDFELCDENFFDQRILDVIELGPENCGIYYLKAVWVFTLILTAQCKIQISQNS